jgi:hypothetical protein
MTSDFGFVEDFLIGDVLLSSCKVVTLELSNGSWNEFKNSTVDGWTAPKIKNSTAPK